MIQTATRMSLDEFLALPERKPALEYEDGLVTRKVSPKGRHSRLQTVIVRRVSDLIEPYQFGMAFTELRATFAGMSRVPDIAIYRWDRIPLDARGDIADIFTEPPDVAIEIASPGQNVKQLIRRLISFVHAGVLVAVLVDPKDRSVVVARPGSDLRILKVGDTLDLDDAIPGLRLEIAAIFGALRIERREEAADR